VPLDLTAAPDHDWNERITRECYAPLAAVPIRNSDGEVTRTVNCYEWLSFDVGPTLARWLEREHRDVYQAMQAGDRQSVKRTGFGTAIAAPYHHVILPLASRREKVTEIRWGVREFRRTFGRDPLGIWLPETAVDAETLEVVAAEGIKYTVLAPGQVVNADPEGRPMRWKHGKSELLICCYDGELAHGVAFGDLLNDGERMAGRLKERAQGQVVTSLATDGETFGHHHKWGDLAVGTAIDRLVADSSVQVVGFDEVAMQVVPSTSAELVEPSSWSCSHGVERWRSDCGCRMSADNSQSWRAPLRLGLEQLRAGIDKSIESAWKSEWGDRTVLRNEFGPAFLDTQLPPKARRLLKAERHAMAMFTSCAWFFDDISRVEPWLVLRQAVRALELLDAEDAVALRQALDEGLSSAVTNLPNGYNAAQLLNLDSPPDVVA
jgi:alpha-amylase/alpha-mannosidase (GH57 family)